MPGARARPACCARRWRCRAVHPPAHAAVRDEAAAGGLLHRGLPVGSGRWRRRPPSPAGHRLAMNYGFAYRMATYAELRRMARSAFGAADRAWWSTRRTTRSTRKRWTGTHAFVHRHNACRAYPAAQMEDHPVFAKTGQPLLLPGTNRTSSYLCVPQDTAHRSLYTAATAPAASSPPSSGPAARAGPAGPDDGPAPLRRHRARRGTAPGRPRRRRGPRHPHRARPGAAGGQDAPVRGADMTDADLADDAAWSALLPAGTVWMSRAAPWALRSRPGPSGPTSRCRRGGAR